MELSGCGGRDRKIFLENPKIGLSQVRGCARSRRIGERGTVPPSGDSPRVAQGRGVGSTGRQAASGTLGEDGESITRTVTSTKGRIALCGARLNGGQQVAQGWGRWIAFATAGGSEVFGRP